MEVGPGASPFRRADIFLEKEYESEEEKFAQKAYRTYQTDSKKTVFYKGGKFPFADGEFDYVVCSHVIEHIPKEELDQFIRELARVAKRGYIEFPNVLYEFVNYQPVHLWLMNYRDGVMYFADKSGFRTSKIHAAFREMVYGSDAYLYKAFERYKEAFFCGFEWEGKINYRFVENYDELIADQDLNRLKLYFADRPSLWRRLHVVSVRLKIKARKALSLMKNMLDNKNYYIDKSAILENEALIEIGQGAEIKEGVIIKTYDNKVIIGKNVQLNPFSVIYGGSGVIIGDNVIMAPHCMVAAGNHNHRQLEQPMRFAPSVSRGPIVIEDDVWIGANCTIVDGVRIGKGAVVGANSVVNRDVPPYAVVGGVPAKMLADRRELASKNDDAKD